MSNAHKIATNGMIDTVNASPVSIDMSLVSVDEVNPPAFSPDSLPPPWGEWCLEMASALGCPVDYVAGSLMTAASEWLGNARRVSPSSDWVEPAHLWLALVGKPSEGKTPAQRPFVEVSKRLEREAEPEWDKQRREHFTDTEATKAKQQLWEESVKKAVKNGKEPPEQPDGLTAPETPPLPRVIICDATTQEIVNMLKGNHKGLLLVRDELSGWIGSFDRYTGAGADRSFFLECFNGGRYSVDLVKNQGIPVRVPYASLSILGGFQPDKLHEALSGSDDGFAARFAYVWPLPVPYQPLRQNDEAASKKRFNMLLSAARKMRSLSMAFDENGETVPVVLPLTPQALVCFGGIRCQAIAKARASKGLSAGWHGKTPTRALRLALTFEFLFWAGSDDESPPTAVSENAMRCAEGYLEYLGQMFERIMCGISVSREEADAAQIAEYLLRHKPEVLNARELYQTSGFSHLRNAKRRKEALRVLVETGWLCDPTAMIQSNTNKGRKRGDWVVNPELRRME